MAAQNPYHMRNSRKRAEAVEARGTGFREGTNLGQSPNSQGTLFQGGKPTDEHRWPRGYSPTRMEDVKDTVPIRISHKPEEMSNSGSTPVKGLGGLEFGHPYLNPDSTEHTKRMIREPIARSTYQREDLSMLGGIHLRASASGARDRMKGVTADYNSATRGLRVNPMPAFGTDRGEAPHFHVGGVGSNAFDPSGYHSQQDTLPVADSTLMHEIGHHVDFQHNMPSYQRQIQAQGGFNNGGRGRAEQTADTHMIENMRNDPRNQRKTNFDVHGATYGQRLGAESPSIPTGYQDPSRHAAGVTSPGQFGTMPRDGGTVPLWLGRDVDRGKPGRRMAHNGEMV